MNRVLRSLAWESPGLLALDAACGLCLLPSSLWLGTEEGNPWSAVAPSSSVSIDFRISGKKLPANVGDVDSIPGQENTLKEERATHSTILAWKTP